MKTKIILLLFSSTFLFAQSSDITIKQITNVDGDARNVFIPFNPYGSLPADIFFEVQNNKLSNIFSIRYSPSNDEFDQLIQITNDSSLDINPVFGNFYPKGYLFFQTNRNGNWDIAYKVKEDSTWSGIKFLANSSDDETHPTLFSNSMFGYNDSLRILYQKNSSIYMSTLRDSSFFIEKIFDGTDSIKYSQPTGIYSYLFNHAPPSGVYVAAKLKIDNKAQIVFKHKNNDGVWDFSGVSTNKCDCNNPHFLVVNYMDYLAYENKLGSFKNIYLMYDWVSMKTSETIKDTITGDLSDLRTDQVYIVTKRRSQPKVKSIELYSPNTYKYLINDSLFISTNKLITPYYSYSGYDTLIYTKVKKTSLALGSLGFDNGAQIFYTVWEDSTNGHIQLFGNKRAEPIGAVNATSTPNNFYLYQNYPNPFNPTTKIEFYLIHGSFTKLIIYNSLGKKVKELINSYLPSGKHEINFIQTKKMILLR